MDAETLFEKLKKAQEPKGYYFNLDKERVMDLLAPLETGNDGEIWVTGTVSDMARSNLESSGWKLHINAANPDFSLIE